MQVDVFDAGTGALVATTHRIETLIGPDGTWTLAGMVGGDPATATEFLAEFRGGFPPDVGDVTLDS